MTKISRFFSAVLAAALVSFGSASAADKINIATVDMQELFKK